MYVISNNERRDIVRMLETLQGAMARTDTARRAGLLLRRLERKEEIPYHIFKTLRKWNNDNKQQPPP